MRVETSSRQSTRRRLVTSANCFDDYSEVLFPIVALEEILVVLGSIALIRMPITKLMVSIARIIHHRILHWV